MADGGRELAGCGAGHPPRSNIVPVYTFNMRIAILQLSSRASTALSSHSILLGRKVLDYEGRWALLLFSDSMT
jgi:hypothetical protein